MAKISKEPKWRRFEKLVAKVQSELAPNALVIHNDLIPGHLSHATRQVDISVRQSIGQYNILIVLDCKDLSKPADVKDVEQFIELIKDVGANKGAMVAANGFSTAAKNRAADAGIDLYRLVDAEAHEWQTYVTIPVVCDFRGIKRFRPKLRYGGLLHIDMRRLSIASIDGREIVLYGRDHRPLGTIPDVLRQRWHNHELPTSPGLHGDLELVPAPTFIKEDEAFLELRVSADIIVESRLYFGQLALTQVKGFANEVSGGLLTRGFSTEFIDAAEVERSWLRINAVDMLAVKPLLRIVALDTYPVGGSG